MTATAIIDVEIIHIIIIDCRERDGNEFFEKSLFKK